MYRLKYDPPADAVHDALPPEASERLTAALEAACHDPIGATQPYGQADDYMRSIATEHALAILFVSHKAETIGVVQLHYLG